MSAKLFPAIFTILEIQKTEKKLIEQEEKKRLAALDKAQKDVKKAEMEAKRKEAEAKKKEEKDLVERFGDDYRTYQKRVPQMVPTIAGIKQFWHENFS